MPIQLRAGSSLSQRLSTGRVPPDACSCGEREDLIRRRDEADAARCRRYDLRVRRSCRNLRAVDRTHIERRRLLTSRLLPQNSIGTPSSVLSLLLPAARIDAQRCRHRHPITDLRTPGWTPSIGGLPERALGGRFGHHDADTPKLRAAPSSRIRPANDRDASRNDGNHRAQNPMVRGRVRSSSQVVNRPREHSQGGDTGSNPVGTTSAKYQVRALILKRPAR